VIATKQEEQMAKKTLEHQAIEQLYESGDLRLTQERNDFLLPQVLDFVNRRRWLNLRPEYQRRLVWDKKKKSLFIESLLMNVPIPPVFLYEYDLSRYEVMDGQQRLNAIIEFYEDNLELTGLETWSLLNGKRRSECPAIIRRGLDRRRISATVLVAETKIGDGLPFDVRREVFGRLNTGGQQLNAQELRNALYPGRFNELLIELASTPLFRTIWNIPRSGRLLAGNNLYRRMIDCEIVLRFFAFRRADKIKGSVRNILDTCMEEYANPSPSEISALSKLFRTRLQTALDTFGEGTFRLQEGDSPAKLSIPLYDAIMVAIDRQWDDGVALQRHGRSIQRDLQTELRRPSVYELVVARANTAKAIKARIAVMERLLKRHI
jgi:hypothetical protein